MFDIKQALQEKVKLYITYVIYVIIAATQALAILFLLHTILWIGIMAVTLESVSFTGLLLDKLEYGIVLRIVYAIIFIYITSTITKEYIQDNSSEI